MLRAYTATRECKTEQENTHSAPSWHAKSYKDTLIQRNHVMLNTTPKIELPRSPNTVPARKSSSCKTNEPKFSQLLLRLSAYQTDPRQGCRCVFRAPTSSQKRMSCKTSSKNGTSSSENAWVLQDILNKWMWYLWSGLESCDVDSSWAMWCWDVRCRVIWGESSLLIPLFCFFLCLLSCVSFVFCFSSCFFFFRILIVFKVRKFS